jgi:hypothetical protein
MEPGVPHTMDKDDKKPKKTAREMVVMMKKINDDNFGGRTEITCMTCHNGAAHPVAAPKLFQPGEHAETRPPQPAALPKADEVLQKYIAALGGEAALEKVNSRVLKGTAVLPTGQTSPIEIDQKAPDSFFSTVNTQHGISTRGYNSKGAWGKDGDKPAAALAGGELDRVKEAAILHRELKMKERYTNLATRGVDKIGNTQVYLVLGRSGANRTERLYFDSASGLLLRRVVFTRTPVGNVPEQTDFEDYRDVDGVKEPFTIRRTTWNSQQTQKFESIQHNVEIDAARFEMK